MIANPEKRRLGGVPSLLRGDVNTPHLNPLARAEREGNDLLREGCAKEMCHSTKRTHFDFDYFSIYETSAQELTSFAGGFANGFVFQNEPILARLRFASTRQSLPPAKIGCEIQNGQPNFYRRFLANDRPDEVFR
jgi:hypothetical protein